MKTVDRSPGHRVPSTSNSGASNRARRSPFAIAVEAWFIASGSKSTSSADLWAFLEASHPEIALPSETRKTPRSTCMRDLRKDGSFEVSDGTIVFVGQSSMAATHVLPAIEIEQPAQAAATPEPEAPRTENVRGAQADEAALITAAKSGDEFAMEAILNKYRNFVRHKARGYFLVGADHDDIIQEGMIGLYKAVRDFSFEKLSTFRSFADICITRQMITAVKSATRRKHTPLNSSISLDKPLFSGEDDHRTVMDTVAAPERDPGDSLAAEQAAQAIRRRIYGDLSGLEREVLDCYLLGRSYEEMSAYLGRHVKSIDNALQRVKRKIGHILSEPR